MQFSLSTAVVENIVLLLNFLISIKWVHQSWHQSICGITCEIIAFIRLEIIPFSPTPENRLSGKISIKADVFLIL
jgi:hypothetical protein